MISILRETHDTPEAVARALELAGGINRFREPNYRAVWGWNRLAWIGGKFAERDPATGALLREVVELRQEPKYPAVNRWHIEKWLPPDTNGRAATRAQQGSAPSTIAKIAKSAPTTPGPTTYSTTPSPHFTNNPS